jgi:hypothetical protein
VYSAQSQAQAEIERRRRARAPKPPPPPVADFIRSLTIEEPNGDDTAIIPFDLWPMQEAALDAVQEHPRVIILKARQLGITWLIIAYALWLCLFHPGKTVLFFSKGQLEADELIRRVLGMYERYTGEKAGLIKGNTAELAWTNGSRMKSLPATENAGRSFTASLILLDEFAFMQWAAAVYSAVKPTIDGGGRMIVLSTADGLENPFHALWTAAEQGDSTFHPIFLPWNARPDRDAAWYSRVEKDALSSTDMAREYPATPEEAFTEKISDPFLESMTWWEACKEPLGAPTRHEPCVLAVDAGVSSDCFALVLVSRHPVQRERPAERLTKVYVPQNGQQLDFDPIEVDIRQLCKQYNIVQIAYDSYQLHQMMTRLRNEGVVLTVPFNQAGDRLIADKQLLDVIMQRKLAHSGNEILGQHVQNAGRQVDDKKLRIVKRKPHLKIDAAVALSMGVSRCLRLPL